ncbi:hypothetical protein [Harryflintia acetispora]|uniref:hypothetical protein n=1 Tax=Harryflintia acetispora TaxID=1849041 RepID=UPI00189A83C4|nr:hypothetical protein [Harryflintia acetispora]
MKRNRIQTIRVHFVPPPDGKQTGERISEFHAALIERRLNGSSLSQKQKCEALTQILRHLEEKRIAD